LGGQPAFAPGTVERFVREPRVAVLAYLRADGRPGQAPIWYTYRDRAFHMSTVTGSPKHRALVREPRV
jgi:nitroimidazol reductase NimA-like FMN-containing flavoprotein (pyridoxamine 5'-phosphate oxidase superfamily)